jgi:hypothetical protein
MLSLVRPRGAPDETTPEPLDELLDGMGLTLALPARFAQDADGRPFEPAQIEQTEDLMAHIALLLRREPVGGMEAQLREHERRTRDAIAGGLNSALARRTAAPRTLLTGLLGAARARKERVDSALSELDERYEQIQSRLHRWQERAGQRDGNLAADRMSLPEVVALWNEREYVALQRAAHAAAQGCFADAVEGIARLLGQLDSRVEEARELALALAERRAARERQPAAFAPWSFRVDEAVVAAALAGRADTELALATLLRRMADAEDATLADQVRAVADAAAERLLAGLSVSDLVALEADGAADGEQDGLVVIGQALLDDVARPSWQLARRARPRIETVQVTPDGAQIFSLDGLGSAAYGDGLDRMGFVQLQLAVALDELAVMAEGEEQFAATLAQRNLYLLDELAAAAAPAALVGAQRATPRPALSSAVQTDAEP